MVYSSYEVSTRLDETGDVKFKVGDSYKCPRGHKAKIVWISEDGETIAVRCPRKHISKVVKVADNNADFHLLIKPTEAFWQASPFVSH